MLPAPPAESGGQPGLVAPKRGVRPTQGGAPKARRGEKKKPGAETRGAGAEGRRQPGLAAQQSGMSAIQWRAPEARRAKENSPGREPWVRMANWRAPERGERSTRLQLFRPVPGLASSSRLSQCSRTGLVCDAPPGLRLRKNRRALRRIGRGVVPAAFIRVHRRLNPAFAWFSALSSIHKTVVHKKFSPQFALLT